MRKKGDAKKGALSVEECIAKAERLIAEHGECLFLMDIVESTNYGTETDEKAFEDFGKFLKEANELYAEYLPLNELAMGSYRAEKGFEGRLGDAAWGGINSARVISLMVKLKDEKYPELRLYYGVAQDGWSEGMELAK